MTYDIPKIMLNRETLTAIQTVGQKSGHCNETNGPKSSTGAYEIDE